jgi:hypothetical protein
VESGKNLISWRDYHPSRGGVVSPFPPEFETLTMTIPGKEPVLLINEVIWNAEQVEQDNRKVEEDREIDQGEE